MISRIAYTWALMSAVMLIVSGVVAEAHESPIDHVDRTISVGLAKRDLVINYRMRMTPRAALLQLRAMDRNQDGRVNDEEKSTYLRGVADQIRTRMALTVGEQRLVLVDIAPALMHPDLSNEYLFAAPLVSLRGGKHVFDLEDTYTRRYPGGVRLRALNTAGSSGESVKVRWSGEPPKGHLAGAVKIVVEVALADSAADVDAQTGR